MNTQKQAAAIHDISGFGRCSLTVALPVLSAAGIQTSVIPTAVLSTHTGGFTGYTFRDLTDDILPIAKHWNGLGLKFDAIYTGFLGSLEQIDIIIEALSLLRSEDTIVIVDPVMADFGKLYTIFNNDFPAAMRKLCARADVIVPNLTEAALLTNTPYSEGPFERKEAEDILQTLAAIGPKKVVLTGVTYKDSPEEIGAASYDAEAEAFAYSGKKRIEPMYHGTGDVFASVLTAALVNNKSLSNACAAAVSFTVEAIIRTKAAKTDNRYGVDFESGLSELAGIISNSAKPQNGATSK
ncbi:MAG: pyridoxamine kinase [Clostridiales Family XIII bacterium]|jgi:pyridoxine kinase|nr:pyridoxamine kinase [Clostridiales Family XIII bacterium]